MNPLLRALLVACLTLITILGTGQRALATPTVTRTPTPTRPSGTHLPQVVPTTTSTPSVLSTIEGTVFLDADSNGVRNPGESGLTVPVTIQLFKGGIFLKQTTTSGGWYAFFGLTAGVTYEVREVQPAGYASTSPDSLFVVYLGGRVTEVNFGEWLPTPTPTATPEGMQTVALRQGLSGYDGARDAHLNRFQPDAPRGDRQTLNLAITADGEARSALLDFDLQSLALPPDTWVVRAALHLYQYNQTGAPFLNATAYGLQRPWDETAATWNRATLNDTWAVPGANGASTDVSSNGASTISIGAWAGWKTWNVTAIVQAWVQQPGQHFGLKLEATDAYTGHETLASFHSKEASDAGLRPWLELWYVIPASTPTPTVTPTPTATETPTPTATFGPLPDLLVVSMQIAEAPGVGCQTLGPLGTYVRIRNGSDANAGPFVVALNNVQQTAAGLVAGDDATLFFEGYAFGTESVATVDATQQVTEIDEANNTLTQMLPIPTPRATCTPTVTPTATATATPTPTATVARQSYLPLIVR